MQIDHRGTNDNNEKLGQRDREGVTWPTFAVLVVKYFTYLKHTALDRLQVRLNVILLHHKFTDFDTKVQRTWIVTQNAQIRGLGEF